MSVLALVTTVIDSEATIVEDFHNQLVEVRVMIYEVELMLG